MSEGYYESTLRTEEALKEALKIIDRRISHHSIPLYFGIMAAGTDDEQLLKKAKTVFTAALRGMYLYDRYHETGENIFLAAAEAQMKIVYGEMQPKQAIELRMLWEDLLKFFDFEVEIREKQHIKKQFSRKEIDRYMELKSSDAYFYARIVEFLVGVDLRQICYVNMRLLDILNDFIEYEKDYREGEPNLIIMMLLSFGREQIPQNYSAALRVMKNLGVISEIKEMVDAEVGSIAGVDLGRFNLALYPALIKADWIYHLMNLPSKQQIPSPY